MTSTSDSRHESQTRTYERADSVVFLKTKERFGGLSNMAGGFPLRVNGIRIRTSEALYQACRFPHLREVQSEIIAQKSPMTAKMKGKPHRRDSRPDWDEVRVNIMRWCLRVKLAQNWGAFSKLLLETGHRAIVEQSRKDSFWGAKAVDDRTLIGMNVLGRLLMELREIVKSEDRESLLRVQPIEIRDFRLGGRPIEVVTGPGVESPAVVASQTGEPSSAHVSQTSAVQGLLFDRPVIQGASRGRAAGSAITGLKSYPAMKDSGVEWLGEVPETWEVRRNGRLFAQRNETGFAELPILEVSLRTGVRIRDFENSDRKQVMSDRDKYKRALAGDIAYNMMRMWQGAVGVAPADGLISPAYVVARPLPGTETRYFEKLFRTPVYMQEVDNYSRGIVKDRNRLYWEDFKAMPTCYPPPEEQAAIVRYLNHVDRPVRRLVRAKRKLIALLTEQKQAIIHRAVTRGLDPDVPLKDSGVEWLGGVPEHWIVTRVKTEFRCLNSRRVPLSGPERGAMTSRKYDYYGASGVIDKVEDYLFDDDLLLIAEDGANLVLRNLPLAIIARGKFWVNNHAHILKPRRGNIEYLAAVMESMNYKPWISGAAQPKLTKDRIMAIAIAVPPPSEQDKIIESVHADTAPLRTAIARANREIELLDEYRTRLIADVVTGKLDVREAAAALPDVDPLDAEDDLDDLDAATGAELDDLDTIPEEAEA